jgi:hypothetical protein
MQKILFFTILALVFVGCGGSPVTETTVATPTATPSPPKDYIPITLQNVSAISKTLTTDHSRAAWWLPGETDRLFAEQGDLIQVDQTGQLMVEEQMIDLPLNEDERLPQVEPFREAPNYALLEGQDILDIPNNQVIQPALEPDQQLLLVSPELNYLVVMQDLDLLLLNASDLSERARFEGFNCAARNTAQIAFSRDEGYLALLKQCQKEHNLTVWEVPTNQPVTELVLPEFYWTTTIRFSPDNKYLLIVGSDQADSFMVLDLQQGEFLPTPADRAEDTVYWGVADFSPDGRMLVLYLDQWDRKGSQDGNEWEMLGTSLRFYDMADFSLVHSLELEAEVGGSNPFSRGRFGFSPSRRWLMVSYDLYGVPGE